MRGVGRSEQESFTSSGTRPPLRWPYGVTVAVSITLYFECMDVDSPPERASTPRWRERRSPDLRYNSFYEYGARVAIFRLLDLFDRLGLSVTVAANALACERYPNIVESFICRGYEIAAHGIAVNRMMSDKLTMEQEKEEIEQTLTRIAGVTGRKPKGWIGQDFRESLNTPSLLAAAGLSYLADWPNDDEPRVMDGASNLVSVPIAYECDDLRLFIERRMQAWIYPDLIRDAFATLYKEGLQRPRVLPLAVHPWVFGAPHRIRYLEKALAPLAAIDGLWWAKAESIADITVTDR